MMKYEECPICNRRGVYQPKGAPDVARRCRSCGVVMLLMREKQEPCDRCAGFAGDMFAIAQRMKEAGEERAESWVALLALSRLLRCLSPNDGAVAKIADEVTRIALFTLLAHHSAPLQDIIALEASEETVTMREVFLRLLADKIGIEYDRLDVVEAIVQTGAESSFFTANPSKIVH